MPKPRRSSIADVAKLAGVSSMTVSNVVNERPGYTEVTKQRVVAAMTALGYRPSRAARTLRSQRTMQLGYHLTSRRPLLTNAFALGFLQSLVEASAAAGYHLVVFDEQDDVLGVLHDMIAAHSVDAFVLADSAADDGRAEFLDRAGVPFGSFGPTAPDLPQSWVDVDNAAGVVAMVDYLVGRGHRTFAYVGYDDPAYPWNAERESGYRAALATYGVTVEERSVLRGAGYEKCVAAIGRLLRRRHLPDAIVTGSDSLALACVNEARSLGLKVGVDVAITGFDGGLLQELSQPTLTTVRVPLDTIAAALVERVHRELLGPTGEPGLLIPTEVSVGGTA
jgi:DNA-binding LacI/PurR family transcriptional regulator